MTLLNIEQSGKCSHSRRYVDAGDLSKARKERRPGPFVHIKLDMAIASRKQGGSHPSIKLMDHRASWVAQVLLECFFASSWQSSRRETFPSIELWGHVMPSPTIHDLFLEAKGSSKPFIIVSDSFPLGERTVAE